jgi:hypothetical protein
MPSTTEQGVKRLEAALRSLELAVERRLSQSAGAEGLTEEVQMLTADRARLAESLDQAQARAARLENVNRDVSRRLATAVETISSVIATDAEGA